ncbi:MAG: aldose 1-epimerase [Acidimicrobiia bacterium]
MSATLAAGELRATFLPELGMLGRSFRREDHDFVALPGGLAAYGDGHQTGLPLLAPWANRLDGRSYQAAGIDVDLAGLPLRTDENGLPMHGTMTAATGWEIVEAGTARLRARFDYGARPDLLAAFPFPHHIELDVDLDGDALRIATTLRPTSARAVPVAFGWHPFLRLPTGDRSAWRLRLPARRHLALDNRGIPTGATASEAAEGAPVGDRTFDDLYALGDDHELALESDDHRLTVHYDDGYPYAQVYAPPGADFVCLEPMTAPTNSLARGTCPLVAPGSSFTARFVVSIA